MLVELGASKNELSAFRVEVSKEKKALEAEYDVVFEVVFNMAMAAMTLHIIFEGVSLGFQPGCRTCQLY